jgi:hypothetical protein
MLKFSSTRNKKLQDKDFLSAPYLFSLCFLSFYLVYTNIDLQMTRYVKHFIRVQI